MSIGAPVDARAGVLRAVAALADAFRARDLSAVLECFAADEDVSYVGSEAGERAEGRAALTALLSELFARDEAYSWRVDSATLTVREPLAYLAAEATGYAHPADGAPQPFPYRVSGLLEHTGRGWVWRACHGCEPC